MSASVGGGPDRRAWTVSCSSRSRDGNRTRRAPRPRRRGCRSRGCATALPLPGSAAFLDGDGRDDESGGRVGPGPAEGGVQDEADQKYGRKVGAQQGLFAGVPEGFLHGVRAGPAIPSRWTTQLTTVEPSGERAGWLRSTRRRPRRARFATLRKLPTTEIRDSPPPGPEPVRTWTVCQSGVRRTSEPALLTEDQVDNGHQGRGGDHAAVGATKAAEISSVGTIPIASAIEKRGWASSAHGNRTPGRRPADALPGPSMDQTSGLGSPPVLPRLSAAARFSDSGPFEPTGAKGRGLCW